MRKTKNIFILSGLAGAAAIYVFLDLKPGSPEVTITAAVAALMAVWWMTEAIPLAATSLIPLILFPALGIASGDTIASAYINSTIFLFLGGFLIALSMEKWDLHRRIALKMLLIMGGSPGRMILGFMLASAFLSMWISNTATAVMMIPIAMAIINQLEEKFGRETSRKLTLSLLIGIAYSCSIGGVATLVGTPPNLALARIYNVLFPSAPEISFAQWMLLGVPVAIVMFVLAWLVITKIFFRIDKKIKTDPAVIKEEYKKLGSFSFEEKSVLIVFASTAVLWIFRTELNVGLVTIPGWSALLPDPSLVNDGTVAIAMAALLFILPSGSKTGSERLLDKDVFKKVPWGIILLFGGGFALAAGFKTSGLSEYIGSQFQGLSTISPLLLMLVVSLSITFLTELTSNTATTQMVLPILASISTASGLNPLLLMLSATLSASMAFMLPVATPPNAVVFGSERISVPDMARTGFLLNLAGAVVITAAVYFIGTEVFNIDIYTVPGWALK